MQLKPQTSRGLWALTAARIRLFLREPASLFWLFGFPALLALGLGTAFRDKSPEPPRVGIATDELALESRDRQSLADTAHLIEAPAAQLLESLKKGSIDLILRTEGDAIHTHYDPQRDEARVAQLIVIDAIERGRGRQDTATVTAYTDMPKGGRYIDFLLPGLIAMNLFASALWGVGYGVVRERSQKLMRRFAMTPLSKSSFLASYLLSRATFLLAEILFLLGFGVLAFDITFQGSPLSFIFVGMLGVMAFMGMAIFISARTANVEVVSGYVNALTMPMWILSGTFFSYERFPEWLHPWIQALPLTALNDALRAIQNDGAALFDLYPEIGVLLAWGALSFTLGVTRFRWR